MLLMLLTLVFLLVYALLIAFYYRQWKRVEEYTPLFPQPTVPVTVVIAARNEEKNLPLLIGDLERQDYPAHLFEVIIVDDFSTDGTGLIGRQLHGNKRMMVPDCSPEASSKKAAIACGVKEAKGELILVTDADCRVQPGWVRIMASFYKEKGASFIAAPVAYKHDHSVVQIFQSLDFITLQGITAASVAGGFHSMCNGANLAYTKKAFEEVRGFEGIDNVPTGDDMLLMHKIWKLEPSKVYYLKSKAAIVSTAPMTTWKDFLMQRRRWASKTLIYDDYRIIAVLGLVLLLNLWFYVLFAAALLSPAGWPLFFLLLIGKTIIEWPFVASVARFYGEQKLMRYFFLFQPLHIFYTVFVGIWSQLGKYEWKGRLASSTSHLTTRATSSRRAG